MLFQGNYLLVLVTSTNNTAGEISCHIGMQYNNLGLFTVFTAVSTTAGSGKYFSNGYTMGTCGLPEGQYIALVIFI